MGSAATWIPTNSGFGADVEVRESNPIQNRGSSSEIASRQRNDYLTGDINAASDRNSAIYTRIDFPAPVVPPNFTTAFRMTYRNNNLTAIRIQDTVTPNPAYRAGLAVYGLTDWVAAASWNESTINYNNAPGITPDGEVGTKDFNSDLRFLGTVLFPEIGTQNHLPIGYQLRFCSAALDQFVQDAITAGYTTVTLVSTVIHSGEAPIRSWINFNYLFNPKEQTTLNTDNYDPGNGMGSIGNLTSTDNSIGEFSPSLGFADVTTLGFQNLCEAYPPPPPPGC
jgi:hypothetical protein